MPGNRRALLCAAPAINYQSIENEHDVAPAEAGTHVRWIPAFAGMTRFGEWRDFEGISVFLSRFDDIPTVKRTFCPPKECYDAKLNSDGRGLPRGRGQ